VVDDVVRSLRYFLESDAERCRCLADFVYRAAEPHEPLVERLRKATQNRPLVALRNRW
jgi:hypothetical protein